VPRLGKRLLPIHRGRHGAGTGATSGDEGIPTAWVGVNSDIFERTPERLLIAADHTIGGTSAGTWSVVVGYWVVCAASSTVGDGTRSVGAGTWSVCRIFVNEGQAGVNGRGTWSVGAGPWTVGTGTGSVGVGASLRVLDWTYTNR
jgi:hypothetical protein